MASLRLLPCSGWRLAWTGWGLLFYLLAPGGAWGNERFAVLIGGGTGWAHDRPLYQAEAEADRLRAVLVELGGFAPDRVQVLHDPDSATVRSQLRSLATTLEALRGQTLVFLYYLGHADERGLHLRGAPLSLRELQEVLGRLPATFRIGVLDVCRSCSMTAGKAAMPRVSTSLVDEGSQLGFVMGTVDQLHGGPSRKPSAEPVGFTHHFISGLRGAADSNGDEAVTLPEAWNYALQHSQQERALQGMNAGQELALTWPGARHARLVLPHGNEERYWVVDERATHVLAEARARPGGLTVLALAPGPYQVKRIRNGQLEVARLVLEPLRRVDAEALEFTVAPPGEGLLRRPVEGLEADALLTWRRREALRQLSAGEAGAALHLFEEVLAEKPEDQVARRGKAHALVLLAGALARGGARHREAETLREALEAEPWLKEDPDFTLHYQRLQRLEADEARAATIQDAREKEVAGNPRRDASWAWGLVGFGGRGVLAPTVMRFTGAGHLYLYGVLDLLGGQAVAGGLRFIPSNGMFGLVLGVGGHVPLFGAPILTHDKAWEGRFGRTVHFDLGLHVFPGAFGCELGFSSVFRVGSSSRADGTPSRHAILFDIGCWRVSQKHSP